MTLQDGPRIRSRVEPAAGTRHEWRRRAGVYPALHEAVHGEATRKAFAELVERYLGDALRYERECGLPLVDTLVAYFEHNANAAATARALGLNRQSLLYRLARFEWLAGVDLTAPTDRFALELAVNCLLMGEGRTRATDERDRYLTCVEGR